MIKVFIVTTAVLAYKSGKLFEVLHGKKLTGYVSKVPQVCWIVKIVSHADMWFFIEFVLRLRYYILFQYLLIKIKL